MNGFRKVEYLNIMKQMYKDKERFKEHIQINNLLKKIKRAVPHLKHKDVEVKEDVKRILTAELVLLLQQLIKVLVVLIKAPVAM